MKGSTRPRLPGAPPRPGTPWLDVWLLRLPNPHQLAPRLDQSELDDRERQRGASFLRRPDAVLYLSAHIALRRVLGGYLGVPPQDVAFAREPCPGCGAPHGRPAVAVPDPPLHFSLSHSSGMALMAVASAPVGADVERTPHPDTVEVCSASLHPDERAELTGTPQEERQEAFGRIWTRKEAYLKGLGTGLSRAPALDYLGAESERRPPDWSILDVACPPRHSGAVAVHGDVTAPRALRWLPVHALLAGGAAALDPAALVSGLRPAS